MGRYFKKTNIEEVSSYNLEAILLIMSYLKEHGNVSKDLTYYRLEILWSDWSEYKYCASFMNPNEELMEEFADWLDGKD